MKTDLRFRAPGWGVLVLAAATLGAVALAGCAAPDAEAEGPAPVTMKGKPDPRFVGVWKTDDGTSTYTFREDGTFNLKSRITAMGNTINADSNGEWSVEGDRIYVKGQNGFPAVYTHRLEGDQLTLGGTGSVKSQTVMKKQ